MEKFKALLATANEDASITLNIEELTKEDLPQGDVLIKVHYSGVNYKDGLAATNAKSGVTKAYPIILGIDMSGEVVESTVDGFKPGDLVIAHNFGVGTLQHGGFSEYARVPAEWLVPLPEGLTAREAMIVGTAGFTAAQSIMALEAHGLSKEGKPVLVRGATGGVGGMSIQMLAQNGYPVMAESRKKETTEDFLKELGASEVVTPDEVHMEKPRPLGSQKFQAVIDPVGGDKLNDYFAQVEANGSVAMSGNAGGVKFSTTVLPFILRGVNLLGINSVEMAKEKQVGIWQRVANDLKPNDLEGLVDHEVTLDELPAALQQIVDGKMKGRTLVKLNG